MQSSALCISSVFSSSQIVIVFAFLYLAYFTQQNVSGFVRVAARIRIPFLLKAEEYSVAGTECCLFLHVHL